MQDGATYLAAVGREVALYCTCSASCGITCECERENVSNPFCGASASEMQSVAFSQASVAQKHGPVSSLKRFELFAPDSSCGLTCVCLLLLAL